MTETDEPDAASESGSLFRDVPWRRVANVVGLIVLVAVVLPFVVYAVPQVVGAEHSFVVLSGSMEPVMSPGDVVIVNDVPPEKIEEGDVITYGAGTPTTHRVIEVVEREGSVAFQTRGDATPDVSPDLVTPGEVRGRVMSVGGYLFVIPFIGHVIQFANTLVGFVLLVAVPLTLLVASEIWRVIAATRSDEPAETAETDDESARSAGEADVDAADSSGTAFTAGDLRLGLLALLAFLVYGAWVTYTTLETWAFGVAGAVGAAFVLLSALYLVGSSGSDGDDDNAGIAFSAAELQLGLVVLAAFLVYGAWVAYTLFEPWSVGVAGAVGVAFVLFASLYLAGGGADGAGAPPDHDHDSTGGTASNSSAVTDSGSGERATTAGGDDAPDGDVDVDLNLLEDVAGQGDATAAAERTGFEQPPDGETGPDPGPDDAGPARAGPDEQVTDGGPRGDGDD